jgi:hypothetical protein
MAGFLTIAGTQSGIPSGQRAFSLTIPGPLSNNEATTNIQLASGFNSVAVPAGATGVIIIPPTANAVALTLKGVTGDTGIAISPSQPSLIMFATSPPASFGVTAAGATTGETAFIFI